MNDLSALGLSGASDMTTVLASSVHDMKNSLNLLISGLEKTLASTSRDTLSTHGELSQMTHEAKRIKRNLVQMLTLYKLDHHLYPFDPQDCAVDDFLLGIAEQSSRLLEAQGIEIELDLPTDLYWPLDEELVASAIGNGIGNAMRYAKGRIRLGAAVSDGWLEIRVEDDGPGYSRQIVEGVSVRRDIGLDTGSTGLGLHFSAKVAHLHRNRGRRGEIRLENGGSQGGGCFVLRLP